MESQEQKQQAASALGTTNTLLTLLILGFMAAFVYVEFFYEPELDSQQAAKYADEIKERLKERAPEIRQEVASVAAEALPPIADAVYVQAQEDYTLYVDALGQQGSKYLDDVEKMLMQKVRTKYDDYLRAHRKVLEAEFPEHASEKNVEKVMAEFEQTLNRLVERYYLDEFRHEADRTAALWYKFEPVAPPDPGQPSLHEQLADYVADWSVVTLTEETQEAASESN